MEKPIMIEWKYYQCTWTVVDNVDVVDSSNEWLDIFWFIMLCSIVLVIRKFNN